jgi:hypothetical protein
MGKKQLWRHDMLHVTTPNRHIPNTFLLMQRNTDPLNLQWHHYNRCEKRQTGECFRKLFIKSLQQIMMLKEEMKVQKGMNHILHWLTIYSYETHAHGNIPHTFLPTIYIRHTIDLSDLPCGTHLYVIVLTTVLLNMHLFVYHYDRFKSPAMFLLQVVFIHSFSSLSYDRSKTSSKTIPLCSSM